MQLTRYERWIESSIDQSRSLRIRQCVNCMRLGHLGVLTQVPHCGLRDCRLWYFKAVQAAACKSSCKGLWYIQVSANSSMQGLVQGQRAHLQHELQRAPRCIVGVPPCCGFQQGEAQGPARSICVTSFHISSTLQSHTVYQAGRTERTALERSLRCNQQKTEDRRLFEAASVL